MLDLTHVPVSFNGQYNLKESFLTLNSKGKKKTLEAKLLKLNSKGNCGTGLADRRNVFPAA